jgi:phage-related protein
VVPQPPHHCHIRPPPIPASVFCGLGWEHLQINQFSTPGFEMLPKTQKKKKWSFIKKVRYVEKQGIIKMRRKKKRKEKNRMKNRVGYMEHVEGQSIVQHKFWKALKNTKKIKMKFWKNSGYIEK